MTTLEENFLESINQHAMSRELWQQQSTLHEQTRAELTAAVNDHIKNAKYKNAILRLTKNQALLGSSGSPPTGWYAHSNCVFENICNIGSTEPSTRHPLAQELLTYIGLNDVVHFGLGFNIWRVSWPANTPYLMYQFLNLSNYFYTVAAYTKLEAGSVRGCWAEGAANSWKLTGQQTAGNMLHAYWMIHPIPSNAAGSLLFAVPAAVIGVVDIDNPRHWSIYPYVGDTQHD